MQAYICNQSKSLHDKIKKIAELKQQACLEINLMIFHKIQQQFSKFYYIV